MTEGGNWRIGDFDDGPAEKPHIGNVHRFVEGRQFGIDGVDNRGRSASVNLRRRSEGHRYEKLNGYAFDTGVLGQMRQQSIDVIYVVDLTEEDVFEYSLDQFFSDSASEIDHGVRQLCVPVTEAKVWGGHARQFARDSSGLNWEDFREMSRGNRPTGVDGQVR